jgi:hypothetical protein
VTGLDTSSADKGYHLVVDTKDFNDCEYLAEANDILTGEVSLDAEVFDSFCPDNDCAVCFIPKENCIRSECLQE